MAYELHVSRLLPASLKSHVLILCYVPTYDTGANFSSSKGEEWQKMPTVHVCEQSTVSRDHVTLATHAWVTPLSQTSQPHHMVQAIFKCPTHILLPHLKQDIDLAPESEKNDEGAENEVICMINKKLSIFSVKKRRHRDIKIFSTFFIPMARKVQMDKKRALFKT